MKLGLLTDIHEHVEELQIALDLFGDEQVDQVVVIGDVFELGERTAETCRLLSAANAVGVWGNHDYGLCVEPTPADRGRFGEDVISFMTSLKPRLVLEGCYFSHVEPWRNPEEVADLWYFEGAPDEHGKLARIFDAVPNRLMFAGHYHKWLLVSPNGVGDWNGEQPISLRDQRYFVVIGALCEGRCAILDTESWVLTPYNHCQTSD